MKILESRVALVTGGSRGIGRGICRALAGRGLAIAINYAANIAAAQQTKELLAGVPTILCPGDLADAAARTRMVDTILEEWGRIDVLVNNAGITSQGRKDLLESTEDSWDRVLGVNLKGPFFLTQRVAREMVRLRERLETPTIVNISSISATAVSSNRGDYCISKSGLSMATKLFAVRLAEHGIHVYEVRPGIMETDMTAAVKATYDRRIEDGLMPIRRWGTPEDVGRAVAMLVEGALPFSTGDTLNVDGGFHVRTL